MKKIMLAALLLVASAAQAAEVVVLEANLPVVSRGREFVSTKFHMDTKTGEGFVKATVIEEVTIWINETWCTPQFCQTRPVPQTTISQIFVDTKKIEDLVLMGDQAVYQGTDGNVVCGTMRPSRIFRVPTLYLSGNCSLESKIERSGVAAKLVVTLRTK
jgi:hypothetical protein